MTDEEIAAAKVKLDEKLGTSSEYIGIAFGYDLYDALWKSGDIKLRKFRAVGLPGVVLDLPAYGEGRYAFADPNTPSNEFVVGKGA